MICIYYSWVATRWHWSADLYKSRKEAAQKEKQYTKQYKNTETQNIKQKYKTKRTYKKYKSSN
jgi:hypothetical protein